MSPPITSEIDISVGSLRIPSVAALGSSLGQGPHLLLHSQGWCHQTYGWVTSQYTSFLGSVHVTAKEG